MKEDAFLKGRNDVHQIELKYIGAYILMYYSYHLVKFCLFFFSTYYTVIQDGDESSPILTSFEIVKVPDPQMSMVSYCQISYESAFLQSDYDLDPQHTVSFKKNISVTNSAI